MKGLRQIAHLISRVADALASPPRIGFACAASPTEILVAIRWLLAARASESGRAVLAYERDWSTYLSMPHAVSFGSGRLSLFAILKGLNVGSGDEVIVPGFTCVVVPNAVLYTGARPVFADIERRSLNSSLREIEARISSRTKAFILSHNFGIPGDVEGAQKLSERYGIPLIEDCAHALGARYKGHRVGTFGTAAFFSTEESKVISTVRGGLAATNNDALGAWLRDFQARCPRPSTAEVRRILVQHVSRRLLSGPRLYRLGLVLRAYLEDRGLVREATRAEELVSVRPADYEARLSDAQAELGRLQLARLDALNAVRRANAAALERVCAEIGVETIEAPADTEPVFLRFPVRVGNKAQALSAGLCPRVEIGNWFESVTHPGSASRRHAGYEDGACPIGEAAAAHVVNLPTHRALRGRALEDVRRVLFRVCA